MRIFRSILIVLAIFSLLCTGVFAAEAKRIAAIAELNGTVEVKTVTGKWLPASVGMLLNQGDMVRTGGADSLAILNLDGNAQTAKVEIRENSQLKLAELLEDKAETKQTTLLDLSIGKILIQAKKLDSIKSKFEVKTPTSVVGVRGTTFSVLVEALE
jgi:hypothetical protein